VLPHQRDKVSVGDVVSPRAFARNRPIQGPETFPFSWSPDMRPIQQRPDVRYSVPWRKWRREDRWMRNDPQVRHHGGPEEIDELRPGSHVPNDRFSSRVERISGVRCVNEDVRVER
jgi:hypothetical protein